MLEFMLWYIASYIIVLVAVTVAHKRGHSFFPSAFSAICLCWLWPILALVSGVGYLYEVVGPAWRKVEDWWDR